MENVYHQNASEVGVVANLFFVDCEKNQAAISFCCVFQEVSHEESILGDEELSDDATLVNFIRYNFTIFDF